MQFTINVAIFVLSIAGAALASPLRSRATSDVGDAVGDLGSVVGDVAGDVVGAVGDAAGTSALLSSAMSAHPHLPRALIQSMKLIEGAGKSTSYNPTFRVVRLDIQNPFDTDFDANILLELPRTIGLVPQGYRCTYLHDAVFNGDVILACEMIRLGAGIDIVDSRGNTPLMIGTIRLAELYRLHGPLTRSFVPSENPYPRIATIVRTLVEHLANANFTSNRRTPLHHACETHDWELITLLINHGANPSLRGTEPLIPSLKAADAQRIQGLLDQYDRIKDKGPPRRPCPCFSGLFLDECHAKRAQPYPEHHACPGFGCQGLKPYGECCLPRGIQALEAWDASAQRIKTEVTTTIYPDPEEETEGHPMFVIRRKLARYFSGGLNVEGNIVDVLRFLACNDKACPKGFDDRALDAHQKLGHYCARALTEDFVDPAYKPVGQQRTKEFCHERQERWNAAVDRYIAKRIDARPREEIEKAAKLGKFLVKSVKSQTGPIINEYVASQAKEGGPFRRKNNSMNTAGKL
ncbi:hypothetical protein PLEOSDRAFT_168897 [Pleurotus ostreatus PC15]|uniref:C2H2-type domain-containing protein n=1 Tax=Pleurotus ostreatus (strain PC15) TaxID=1137138 RepID=A0A067NG01_PLEO1|nr:hypothetical protein PLEOSDRAFT_168897 [Pleurotus ostreatus PC15]